MCDIYIYKTHTTNTHAHTHTNVYRAASAALIACAVVTASRVHEISEVIIPIGDLPPGAQVNRATRELIDAAVNGEDMRPGKGRKSAVAEHGGVDATSVKLIKDAVHQVYLERTHSLYRANTFYRNTF